MLDPGVLNMGGRKESSNIVKVVTPGYLLSA